MKILIIGQGGREHALAYRLARNNSNQVDPDRQITVCPGNAGISKLFPSLRPTSPNTLGFVNIAKQLNPDLVVIGPEVPLAEGLVDALQALGYPALGPSQAAAQLEASKWFMKTIAAEAGVKTAASQLFENPKNAKDFCTQMTAPYVIKADGLCAGKGVVISQTLSEAKSAIDELLGTCGAPLFGAASKKIVIEQFLPGKEVSVIGLCYGARVKLFAPVRDHKRLQDGDKGPNTGGMGVIGPLTHTGEITQAFLQRVEQDVFLPLLQAMQSRGTPFRGFLYAGLMVNGDDIALLETNVRFGDPEAQAILFGTQIDLLPDFLAVAKGDHLTGAHYASQMIPTTVVVMTNQGYPVNPVGNSNIIGWENAMRDQDVHVFFSGVRNGESGQLQADGGRVLSVASRASSLSLSQKSCYNGLQHIELAGAHFRHDIGASTLAYEGNEHGIL